MKEKVRHRFSWPIQSTNASYTSAPFVEFLQTVAAQFQIADTCIGDSFTTATPSRKRVVSIARIRRGSDKKEVTWDIGTPNAKQRQAFLARTLYVGYGGA